MRQVITTAESKAEKQWTYIKLTISLQRIIPSTVEVQRDISEKKVLTCTSQSNAWAVSPATPEVDEEGKPFVELCRTHF